MQAVKSGTHSPTKSNVVEVPDHGGLKQNLSATKINAKKESSQSIKELKSVARSKTAKKAPLEKKQNLQTEDNTMQSQPSDSQTLMQLLTTNESALQKNIIFEAKDGGEPDIVAEQPACLEEEQSDVTVTEPPTMFMLHSIVTGNRLTQLIPEEPIEHSPIESIGELDHDSNNYLGHLLPESGDHAEVEHSPAAASITVKSVVKIVYPNEIFKVSMIRD